ncbi:aldo/keto reductase [Syntrophobotulus glycolicus DSM 8271]|uniref:Aldo/keto reductase n=1 Tax=Syntrophobotulus glycolicus (strain DSM 8271 / FlGlyR) TaxID=645991 RepID=F0SVP5_SYNGF|nr:aldo/keto reductase [Syntrophobotulus glycolicus]ADY54521.1 aldo/keto reductase [Syntrophobotulus glycolicus DSM 8271]
MQYRQYGKLGYQVSLLGMGCMRLPLIIKEGQNYAGVDLEKALEIIRYAAEHGVNYFDTAFGYHRQTSEAVLGEALDSGYRVKVKIATKQPINAFKTRDDIRRNLENTLKKLRTDYIDVYLLHNVLSRTWAKFKELEVIEEYEKFRAEGLIRAIGFSYHGEFPCFKEVLDYYPWDMCQIQQNLLDVDREVTEDAIKIAGQKGTALVIMEPLRGGGLAGAPQAVQAVYDVYEEKRPPVEWAFRHLVDYPEISCILSGMTTLEQLKENIALFSRPDFVPGCLTSREHAIIQQAKAAYESLATIPCTGCGYCMPCPNGVNISDIFLKYNAGCMFENFDQSKRSYMFTVRGEQDASHCAACGLCEEKCPQSIAIGRQLQIAHAVLDGWVE